MGSQYRQGVCQRLPDENHSKPWHREVFGWLGEYIGKAQ